MSVTRPRGAIAVIGSGNADEDLVAHARTVGRTVAEAGWTVVCGGLGGVMAGVCQGAREDAVSGPEPRTVGILPGDDVAAANAWVDVPIATGIGYARNVVIVQSVIGVIAVGGESGTLSEIAHAWQGQRPIAAWLPAGGWGERLAETTLDSKRADRITSMRSARELVAWLDALA